MYLSKYFKKYRKHYYNALLNVSEKQDYKEWVEFFLEGIIETSQEGVELAREIKDLRENDLHKIQSLGRSTKNGDILFNYLFKNPVVSIDDVVNLLNIKFPNAQNIVNKLINLRILYHYDDRKRNRLYQYSDYLEILLKE